MHHADSQPPYGSGDVLSTLDIDRSLELQLAPANLDEAGAMDNLRYPGARPADRVRIADVSRHEFDIESVKGSAITVLAHQRTDIVAAIDQQTQHIVSNKTRCTGD